MDISRFSAACVLKLCVNNIAVGADKYAQQFPSTECEVVYTIYTNIWLNTVKDICGREQKIGQ